MVNKHRRPYPHSVSNTAWWYEENAGIVVVVQHASKQETQQIQIRWTDLRRALGRKDKKP